MDDKEEVVLTVAVAKPRLRGLLVPISYALMAFPLILSYMEANILAFGGWASAIVLLACYHALSKLYANLYSDMAILRALVDYKIKELKDEQDV
jgi:hypothetical protein